ncbi:hypothetical protein OV090_31825 [Nannocystis sp. RBIL2]|uniref:hypothetical protein n=1 Tax=Nannocystis sp. RBIL2 TaxID=2996788 RepID=UPI0022718883|nr:hypothetical protein [Nannocystis sp. RBIL2]MCY1069374.1 hypothetical protein [Nannocystis sp. RBIL2]
MRRPLIAALLLAACGPTAPAPTEVAKSAPAEAAKAPPPSPPAAPAPAATPAEGEKLEIPKEPPLTPEEIALIEADPKTLEPEQRRARAHALRRKILQNPDSPQAQQLEKLRRDVEAGVVKPELPPKSADSGKGLTLHAPGPSNPAPAPAP